MKPSRKPPVNPSEKIRRSPALATLRHATTAAEVLSDVVRAESVRLTRDARTHDVFGQITAVADITGITPAHASRKAAGDDPADERVRARLATGCGTVTGCTVDRSKPRTLAVDFTLRDEDDVEHAYEVVIREKPRSKHA